MKWNTIIIFVRHSDYEMLEKYPINAVNSILFN